MFIKVTKNHNIVVPDIIRWGIRYGSQKYRHRQINKKMLTFQKTENVDLIQTNQRTEYFGFNHKQFLNCNFFDYAYKFFYFVLHLKCIDMAKCITFFLWLCVGEFRLILLPQRNRSHIRSCSLMNIHSVSSQQTLNIIAKSHTNSLKSKSYEFLCVNLIT